MRYARAIARALASRAVISLLIILRCVSHRVARNQQRLALLSRLAEITPKETWWENILKEQIALSSPPSSIQRFMELMQNNPIPNGREREASAATLSFRIARIKQLIP